MAFNGSGVFLRVMNWVADAQAGILVRADRHDVQDDDYAAGLSNCITRDGQSQPVANIPMNGHKLVNLAEPTDPKDAATKGYADTPKPYTGGVIISGADTNGMVNFTSLTGANGLSFVGADLSWLARLATAAGPGTPPVPPATLNRLVLNDKPDGSGADVATFNDDGSVDVGKINIRTTANITGVLTAAGLAVKPALAGPSALVLYDTDGTTARASLSVPSAGGNANLLVGGNTFAFAPDGQSYSPSSVHAGSSYLATNGNITGSSTVWANWGYNDAFNAIAQQIENRALAYAQGRVNDVNLQRVAITYAGNVPGGGGGWVSPGGTVIVGYAREAGTTGQVNGLYYATLQIYDSLHGWRNMSG